MIAQVEKICGVSLGPRQIFGEAATIAGMARLIEHSRQGQTRTAPILAGLVTIKADGPWPALFAMPGSGGNPIAFVRLGRLLDPRQPLVGIAPRGIDGLDEPLTRMEDIAAENILRIREKQPHGPYFLAGTCFGARVAYEMARQLEMAGEPIGLLLMLDPSPPFCNAEGQLRGALANAPYASRRFLLARFVWERARQHAALWVNLRAEERWSLVREKMSTLYSIVKYRDVLRGKLHQRRVYLADRQAGTNFVPGPFGGPTTICITRDRPTRGERDYRRDWLDLVSQTASITHAGGKDIGEMLNVPHVYEWADFVNRALIRAHAKDLDKPQERSRELWNAQ